LTNFDGSVNEAICTSSFFGKPPFPHPTPHAAFVNWKQHIISLTETPTACSGKIDASFFPPNNDETLSAWEANHQLTIPTEIRSFLMQSDGLEAQRGEIWPILPFSEWVLIDDPCATVHPWLQFGETAGHHYLLSLGHSPSIYRVQRFGSDQQFFASSFQRYLELIYRGEG